MRRLTVLLMFLLISTGCENKEGIGITSESQLDSSNVSEENNSISETEHTHNDNFQGMLGNYELIGNAWETKYDDTGFGNYIEIHVKYTNSTNKAQQPLSAFEQEMILEDETDLTVDSLTLTVVSHAAYGNPELDILEEEKLKGNGHLNIKPGASVDFIISIPTPPSGLKGTLYLRNKSINEVNGNLYEKIIYIE